MSHPAENVQQAGGGGHATSLPKAAVPSKLKDMNTYKWKEVEMREARGSCNGAQPECCVSSSEAARCGDTHL